MDQVELTLSGQYPSADMLIFLSVCILTRECTDCDSTFFIKKGLQITGFGRAGWQGSEADGGSQGPSNWKHLGVFVFVNLFLSAMCGSLAISQLDSRRPADLKRPKLCADGYTGSGCKHGYWTDSLCWYLKGPWAWGRSWRVQACASIWQWT